MKRPLWNMKGFSLVEVAIGSAVMVGLGAATLALLQSLQSGQGKANVQLGLVSARTEIARALASKEVLKSTIVANASLFSCVRDGSDCRNTPGANRPLSLVYKREAGVDRIVKVAGYQPNEGLSLQGAPCNSFNPGAGNNECPFRYEVSWRPICPASGPCANPTIELRAELKQSFDATRPLPKNLPNLDPAKYRIVNLHAEKSSESASESCRTINGTVISDAECAPLFHNTGICPSFIIGFEADGRPICGNMSRFRCPVGQVLSGFNTDGTVRCEGGCQDPSGNASGIFFGGPAGGSSGG